MSLPSLETLTENKMSALIEIGGKGLTKQLLRKGTSWQTPFPGDQVEVRFSGHIDGGACLDSIAEEGPPFQFQLGQGEVIKGWDEGVATMRKGEKAVFRIPPKMAYGEAGCPPLVPSNSTLIFTIEMVCWSTVRDITGDGGLLKKVTREGEGWATPRDGDEVLVKYEARLDEGVIISKSEGVTCHVGDGHPCPAINKAVRTMRRGEKAELAVKFSYGFEQGNGSAHQTIDVEVISWKSVTDIIGDGNVLKKIVKEGEGHQRPNDGSLVKVKYVGKLEDGSVVETIGSDEEPFEYNCMEEQISNGLDRAIMTMKKGEHAVVTVRDCAKPVLLYEVNLFDFAKEKPFWKMDATEKLEACERKKQDGNALFKASNFRRASKKYEKGGKYVELSQCFSEDEKSVAKALWLSCTLNNAACQLKLQDYHQASKLCTKVLEVDPTNVKALYRRSQAYIRTSQLEKAETDINKALTIDPNNRDVKLEYKELKEKQRQYSKHQSQMFGTMFFKTG